MTKLEQLTTDELTKSTQAAVLGLDPETLIKVATESGRPVWLEFMYYGIMMSQLLIENMPSDVNQAKLNERIKLMNAFNAALDVVRVWRSRYEVTNDD